MLAIYMLEGGCGGLCWKRRDLLRKASQKEMGQSDEDIEELVRLSVVCVCICVCVGGGRKGVGWLAEVEFSQKLFWNILLILFHWFHF